MSAPASTQRAATMRAASPTPKQAEILRAVASYKRAHRRNPSLVETGTYRDNLELLKRLGWLTWEPSVPRSLTLTTLGKKALRRAAR